MEDEIELDNALVMDAAFQIIDASLNTKDLFQEMCQVSRKLQDEKSINVSMTDLLSVTCRQIQEHTDGLSDKSLLSTPALAQEVIRLADKTTNHQSPACLHTPQENWRVCLSLIEESIRHRVFISSLFTSWISKRGLSFDFLWDLHQVGAYDLERHLSSKLKEVDYQSHLSQTVISWCQGQGLEEEDNSIPRRDRILTGVTNLLINKCFMEGQDTKGRESKTYLTVVDMLLGGIMTLSAPSSPHLYTSPFTNLNNGDLNQLAKNKFVRHALSYCIQHQADFNISEDTPSVTDHKPSDADKFLQTVFKQLLDCLSPNQSLDVLNHCLKCDQVNSRTTLAFLAALLSSSEHARKYVSDFIKTTLTSGLQNSDTSQVTSAFYIARMCCSLTSLHFPSYRDWYQQTFGEPSTSCASSRTSFGFLIKCLTQWVPGDTPECLKAHILRRPFIPPRMREVYESYVLLAKTRLDDLKISLRDVTKEDNTGQSDIVSAKEHQLIQLQQEVDGCVKSFEETGKIPTYVLEASIFRKPYFIGKFLPALLKPRCLPDRPDCGMRFIDEMRKSGKIPSAMYNTYVDGCEREKQNLLEGVFDIDDEEEDMLLSPLDQLQFRMDRLCDDLCKGGYQKVGESLSLVEERVCELVMTQSKVKGHDEDTIEVNLCRPIDSLLEQIINKFISCVCRGLEFVLKDSQTFQTKQQIVLWCDRLVGVLVRFPVLKTSLISYVLQCVDRQIITDPVIFNCLSVASISIMARSRHSLLRVTSQNGSLHTWGNLMEACHHFLSWRSQEEITFGLRFYTAHLFHTKHYLDGNDAVLLENTDVVEVSENNLSEGQLLPAIVIKKITLLCSRCRLMKGGNSHTLTTSNLSSLHKELDKYVWILHSDWWKRLMTSCQPNLDEWIQFELSVDPYKDILVKRQRWSYFWESCGKFIQDIGVTSVCTRIFHLLTGQVHLATERKQPSSSPSSKDDSYTDFISLLKGLLLQLPSGDVDENKKCPWLLSTIKLCPDKSLRSRMLSLSLQLDPHLLVRNTRHVGVSLEDQRVVQNGWDVLDLFAESDLNCGGYFSLDVTIFIMQACDSFHQDCLVQFLSHPAVLTSIMFHQECLHQVGALSSCPQHFKHQLNRVARWVIRLSHRMDSQPMDQCDDDDDDDDNDDEIDDKMKACALFAFLINEGSSSSVSDSILNVLPQDTGCLSCLWELVTVWFVYNLDDIIKTSRDAVPSGVVQSTLSHLVVKHPTIVSTSMTPRHAGFRQHLGVHHDSQHLHTYCVLRQCSAIKLDDIPVNASTILSCPLISAYTDLLQGMDTDLDPSHQVPVDKMAAISSWLQSVVKSCHPTKLINIDMNILHTCDPLLYRQIYLQTSKSGRS